MGGVRRARAVLRRADGPAVPAREHDAGSASASSSRAARMYVEWLLRLIGMRLVPEFAPMSTLEYGCGIGRLAIPFARRPGRVTAVDRSPTMLATARREADRQGTAHIEFQTPDELSLITRAPAASSISSTATASFNGWRRPTALRCCVSSIGLLARVALASFISRIGTTTSPLVEASRRIRARVPALNGVVNTLRGKPFDEPFIASHSYDLDDVFRVLDDAFRARFGAPIAASHLMFEHQQGFSAAVVFVQAPLEHGRQAVRTRTPAQPVDVRRCQGVDCADVARGSEPNGRGIFLDAVQLGASPREAVQPRRRYADAVDGRRDDASGSAPDGGDDGARVRRGHRLALPVPDPARLPRDPARRLAERARHRARRCTSGCRSSANGRSRSS